MGRNYTGAATTNAVPRIELSYLLKQGFIAKGKSVRGTLSWTSNGEPAGSIGFESCCTAVEKYFRVYYTLTDRNGVKSEHDYRIRLEAVTSNLGKGEVLYFICPSSGLRCRILYRAYGCPVWKARKAYSYRIYYPLQVSSRMSRYNDRYWELEKKREQLSTRKYTETYNGKKTRHAQRMELLWDKIDLNDHLRWGPWAMPKRLHGIFKDLHDEQ